MAALTTTSADDTTDLSKQYDTPMGLAHTTVQALKDRIKLHYDLASDYYLKLWGEHIHHGYWPTDESKSTETKEQAQINLITLLLEISQLKHRARVLDVGCGVGGTSRYLASVLGCTVVGITISTSQVEIATRLTKAAATAKAEATEPEPNAEGFYRLGRGRVKFIELDAEKMGDHFAAAKEDTVPDADAFDAVWISEALSHFPNKRLFFTNARQVLRSGGVIAFADWAKAEDLTETEFETNIKPIEDGMLTPPLPTIPGYVESATEAGLRVLSGPKDISKDVLKTWDITWSLIQSPSLWAFAFSQGRDGIAFLQAFRAMRSGYANGTFRYAVIAFQK